MTTLQFILKMIEDRGYSVYFVGTAEIEAKH